MIWEGLPLFVAAAGWAWLLLPALVLVTLDAVRPWGTASRGRRFAGGLVRALVMSSFALAMTDPRWHRKDDVAHLVIVLDRSASLSDEALDEALARANALRRSVGTDARVGLVLFDAEPTLAVLPGAPWELPQPLRETPVEATDLDAAIELALGTIPAQDGGAIVVLSDGRDTSGRSDLPAVEQAIARGVAIHTIPVAPRRTDPAVTEVVLAQTHVRPGASLQGHVVIDGSDELTRGRLVVRAGDVLVHSEPVEIAAGERLEVPFSHELDIRTNPGPLSIGAELIPDGEDIDPGNNRSATTAVVGAPPQVRVFVSEGHDGAALARALRAERMDVQVVELATSRPEDEKLDDVDLVVLANAPAASLGGSRGLSTPFLEDLARFVDRGGGLLVLGGPQAFDMGGYGHGPLSRVLPVRLDPVDPEVQAGATMIIILDRSGSMSAMVGLGKTKMELADEGAAASIRMLRPFDRVGVMSVTETVRWEVPVQPVRDPAPLERRVLRVRADGGGIFVYTSLVAAQKALMTADTPLRHVILFSDCADSEEKVKGIPFGTGPGPTAEDVAREMRAAGITTSVIGIGTETDIDTPFLKDLARAGGGRFYLTDDATKLRSLFVEETERIVDSSLHEASFRPEVARPHPIVEGIDYPRGPELRGYQELEPRPTAEVVLTGPGGHPILVTWRYGLGQVVAWASDAGPRWAENWLGWDGYTKQWTQAARFALRERAGDDTAVEVDFVGTQARIRVARRDGNGLSLDELGLRARVRHEGKATDVTLHSPEPGLWEATMPTQPESSYTLEVLDPAGKLLAEHTFAPPPSAERRHRTPDLQALEALAARTGGTHAPTSVESATVTGATTDVVRLWPWLILLGLLLLPIDAFVRRPARVL